MIYRRLIDSWSFPIENEPDWLPYILNTYSGGGAYDLTLIETLVTYIPIPSESGSKARINIQRSV